MASTGKDTIKPGALPPGLSPNTLNLARLTTLSGGQLALLYGNSPAGSIPLGNSRGRAIFIPGTILGAVLSWLGNLLWKGKVVDAAGHGLVNKILGLKLVRAMVFRGESWSDGKPSIIIDYLKTSLLAFFIRDEIRCVSQGLYLGKAYIRLPFKYRFCALWFALDFER
jgi:hypothetical protein